MVKIFRTVFLLLCLALIANCLAIEAAEAAVPVPPGYKTTAPLEQPDVYPLRQYRFKAILEDPKAPAGVTEVSYSYEGFLMENAMIDAGLADSLQKDILKEEIRCAQDKFFEGKESFEKGTLFLSRIPPRGNEMHGSAKEEYYNAMYYEKMGRGKLRIELTGVIGGKATVKSLIEFMRKGTNPVS